ncbi:cystathionine gamma-synthase [Salipaludibacillus neizhouensis]|uniref:homocysteine desulfhydrase n=1 Tax=Salipaludibacillus neizhouensis TaxID=885475 RepID=A0A3A9K3Q7_9BACI|nr:PLP-dependent aspartate aminotransferase family protein [Salipaludibacillus neizhouensis]RKL64921.1 cystathionine gamma-synthase [Salipaludibacillus neizhouensis]
MRFQTKNVHFQHKMDSTEVSKTKPIFQTSAFSFENFDDMEGFFEGKKNYLYSRMGNPNTDDLGKGVADLEGAEAGVATSSGLSAILAGILSVAKAGDHVVATQDLYGGTYQLLARELPDLGISVSFVNFESREEIEEAITENTVLLYSESVTNPLLRVEDLTGMVKIAASQNLKTMVDNTFATPYLIRPHEASVDIVVHSATKYIGGHSDVTAGVVTGNFDLMTKAQGKVSNLGSNLGPMDGWLACRGLKTLSLRMQKQCDNAQELAKALKENDMIKSVHYPTAVSQHGNGAIVTVDFTDELSVHEFSKRLEWIKIVPTLAGLETSITYPAGTSHRSMPKEMREKLGVTDSMIRISVGIEDAEDIIAVFKKALS